MSSLTLQINLREHKFYNAYDPEVTFTKTGANEIQAYSSQDGAGRAYFFVVFSKVWLHGKKIRIDWANNSMADVVAEALLYDGEYNRANDADFPTGAEKATKSNGLLSTLRTHVGSFDEDWTSASIDTSGAFCSKVTLFLQITDAWAGVQFSEFYLRLVQVLDGTTIVRNETCGSPVVMEKTGTVGDFGYVSVDYWTPPLLYLENAVGTRYGWVEDKTLAVNFGDVTKGSENILPLYLVNESVQSGKTFRNAVTELVNGGADQVGTPEETYLACGLSLSATGPWTSSLALGNIIADGGITRSLFYIRYAPPASSTAGPKRCYLKIYGFYLWDYYQLETSATIPPFISEAFFGIISNVATIPAFINEVSLGRLPELGVAPAYAMAEGSAVAAKLGYATASPTPVASARLPNLGAVPVFVEQAAGLGRLPSKGQAFPMVTWNEALARLPNLATIPKFLAEESEANLPDVLLIMSAMAGLPSYTTRAVSPDALQSQNVGLSVADAYIAWIGKTLPASFTIMTPGFANLHASFLSRHSAFIQLSSSFDIQNLGYADLSSVILVQNRGFARLSSKFILRNAGSKNLPASFFARPPYADLPASLTVRQAYYIDLPASISPETQLIISEDSWCYQIEPNTNFNYDFRLVIGENTKARAFLKFNLSNLDVGLAIIKARIAVTTEFKGYSGALVKMYDCPDDSWSESTITWNNMPISYGVEVLNWNPGNETDEQRYFVTNSALTGFVQKAYESASKLMSLVLLKTGLDYGTWSSYYSKTESQVWRRVRLLLTFGFAGAADLSGSFQVNHP